MDDENRPVIHRREMLRRAAIVGGNLLWAVPAVQTLAPKAFAQASPVFGCCECRNGPPGKALCNGLDHITCTTSGSATSSATACAQYCASQGLAYCFHASPSPLTCVDATPGNSPIPRSVCSG
jgi:hypothetical protein